MNNPENDDWIATEYNCLIHLKYSDSPVSIADPKAKGIILPGLSVLVQELARRPFSKSTREGRVDHERILTRFLSQQGLIIGGLLPSNMHGKRYKQYGKCKTYKCEVIVSFDDNGNPVGCNNGRKARCGCMCESHYKQANVDMYGGNITPDENHIYENRNTRAKKEYDALATKHYGKIDDDSVLLTWINAESQSQQLTVVKSLLAELKVIIKKVKFLHEIDGKWYEMKEQQVIRKVRRAFQKKDKNYNSEYYVACVYIECQLLSSNQILYYSFSSRRCTI